MKPGEFYNNYEKIQKPVIEEVEGPTIDKLEVAARPLMKYIAENYNPHTIAVIDYGRAAIFNGNMSFKTEEYIQD